MCGENGWCLWCAERGRALSPGALTRKEMGFAEGQEAGGILFQTVCLTNWHRVLHFMAGAPLQDSLWGHCEACKEHHGPALSRPPSFLSPPSLGNILPSVGVLFPHSHTRHQVSKSQPTLEELPLRGEVALGPGNLGLRLSFRQIWKRHFTSFSLSTLYIRRNRNSCSPTCPTA